MQDETETLAVVAPRFRLLLRGHADAKPTARREQDRYNCKKGRSQENRKRHEEETKNANPYGRPSTQPGRSKTRASRIMSSPN
jgi:hypothetical protein